MKKRLTKLQGLCSMILFLNRYNEKKPFEYGSILLSGLQLFSDGGTADPAFWYDWVDAVKRVVGEKQDSQGLTDSEAFSAMREFLKDFSARGSHDDVEALISVLGLCENNTYADSSIWNDWLESVDEVRNPKEGFCPSECMLVLKK